MKGLGTSFTALWWSSGLSNLADGVLLVGAPLLAASLTSSPLLVSLVSGAATLPWLLLALPAGALADRLDRRRILLLASWSRATVLALTAAAAALGLLSLPVLAVAVLLAGAGEVFSDTAAQSLVPMVVGKDRLAAANGRLTAAQTVGNYFLGAPLAGVLAGLAAAAVFGAAAVLLATAAVALLALRGTYGRGGVPVTSVRADIVSGLRYLAGHRVLRALALFAALLNLAYNAYFAVLVLWVTGERSAVGLDARAYGLLAATLAVGAVAGSVVAERLARPAGEGRVLIWGTIAGAVLLLGPLLAPSFPAVLFVTAFGIGAANAVTNVLTITLRQRLISDGLLGRVNSACRLVGMGAMPLGAVSGGAVAVVAGLPAVFWCSAAVSALAAVVLVRSVSAHAVADAEAAVSSAGRE
ncbi:MFS transporter [Nonomuraea sp. NPDC005650]|uniref:MFS transporter n=1 Tax=Nonomuraea sp. NPDC005650 TaxID=3157045 RepID=UPI0033A92C43